MVDSTRVAVFVAAVCTGACSAIARSETAQPAGVLEACAVEGVPAPARCGTVRVPETVGAATGRHIDLRVIVAGAHSIAPPPDPVVPLAGGPGQGAADLAAAFSQRYAWLRDERDIVLIDQRGTGASNGLQCETPASAADLMGRLFDPTRLAACRDRLAQRAELTQYTTSIAAADYERVFDALGYREVNLIGTSYGSRMGLELARRFPHRVRTLTIEGVVPPSSFDWPSSGARDAEAALDLLIDDCRADAPCGRAFPRFRQDVDLAFTRLSREPAAATVRDPATGAIERVTFGTTDLAYATRGLLYGNDALWLPAWFRQAAEGEFDLFAQAYVTRARALEQQIARGVHLGVYCAEDVPFVDWPLAEKAAAGTRIASYLLDQYRRGCEIWPGGTVTASFREPALSPVPTLLMSGRRDPVTPPRTAEEAARTLPRSRVIVWPNGGHGTDGLVSGECRIGIQREFIRSADPARLDVECVTRDAVMPFRVSRVP